MKKIFLIFCLFFLFCYIKAETYTVQQGDTLWSIAQRYCGSGSKYTDIQNENNLSSDTIYPGDILRLPASCTNQGGNNNVSPSTDCDQSNWPNSNCNSGGDNNDNVGQ